jgi:hypothetical protein
MKWNRLSAVVPAVAFALFFSSMPALAQGKGQGKGNGRRPQVERAEEPRLERRGPQEQNVYGAPRGNGAGKVPPGWCQGVGNPHNTVENCGYNRPGYDGGYYDDGNGSYSRSHEEFHLYLDRKYASLAAERPYDIAYQLRLRADKAAEHDRWHQQAGIAH